MAKRTRKIKTYSTRDLYNLNLGEEVPVENGDVVTQSDLRAAWDVFTLMERIGANIVARIDQGATVERGPVVVEYLDGERGDRPGALDFSRRPDGGVHCYSFNIGALNLATRSGATQIMGKFTKRDTAVKPAA